MAFYQIFRFYLFGFNFVKFRVFISRWRQNPVLTYASPPVLTYATQTYLLNFQGAMSFYLLTEYILEISFFLNFLCSSQLLLLLNLFQIASKCVTSLLAINRFICIFFIVSNSILYCKFIYDDFGNTEDFVSGSPNQFLQHFSSLFVHF